MNRFRLPYSSIPDFKALCYSISESLQGQLSIPRRGSALLNLFAGALGWPNFATLLIDAKQYGDGPLSIDGLRDVLLTQLPDQLGSCEQEILMAVQDGLLVVFGKEKRLAPEQSCPTQDFFADIDICPSVEISAREPSTPAPSLSWATNSLSDAQQTLRTPGGLISLNSDTTADILKKALQRSRGTDTSYADALKNVLAEKNLHGQLLKDTYRALFVPASKYEVHRIYATDHLIVLSAHYESLYLTSYAIPATPTRRACDMLGQVVYGEVTDLSWTTDRFPLPSRTSPPTWWLCKYGGSEPRINLSGLNDDQIVWLDWFFGIRSLIPDLTRAPVFESISLWCGRHPRLARQGADSYFGTWGSQGLERHNNQLDLTPP